MPGRVDADQASVYINYDNMFTITSDYSSPCASDSVTGEARGGVSKKIGS